MSWKKLAVLLAVIAAGITLVALWQQNRDQVLEEQCVWQAPKRLPWTGNHYGLWMSDTLLLEDPFRSRILKYSKERGYRGEDSSILGSMMELRPDIIKPLDGGGWVLQINDGHFIQLDEAMRTIRNFDLPNASRREDSSVQSIYSWSVGDGTIYGCGEYQVGGNRGFGIVRIPLNEPASHAVSLEFGVEHTMFVHCRLGYDLLASIGSTGYVLVMDEKPYVEALSASEDLEVESRIFEDLDLGRLPKIPNYLLRDAFAVTMRAVEKSSMPVSLIAWQDQLFILRREPVGGMTGGMTRWFLMRLDPRSGELLGEAVLPSRSSHLTVVPGEKDWAFVEKGYVQRIGLQDILGIRYVPSSMVATLESGNLCRD